MFKFFKKKSIDEKLDKLQEINEDDFLKIIEGSNQIAEEDKRAQKILAIYYYGGIDLLEQTLNIKFDIDNREQHEGAIDYQKAMYWFKKLADKGISNYIHIIGTMYENGQGVEKDDEIAIEWYEKAALMGFKPAFESLFLIYERKSDKVKLFEWTKKASEILGLANYFATLGIMYERGNGTEINQEKAIEWYEKAALMGFEPAFHCLLDVYIDNSDEKNQFECVKKAVEMTNNPKFITDLGFIYNNGIGTNKDHDKALYYFEMAEKLEDARGIYYLGHLYLSLKNDVNKALSLFDKAANLGYVDSMSKLGEIYQEGRYGIEINNELAFEWLKKAGELGDPIALCRVGEMYHYGEGKEPDYIKACDYYEKSAKLGYTVAFLELGIMYKEGKGVEQDYEKAMKLFKKAAYKKRTIAAYFIAEMYVYGQGVEIDLKQAKMWLEKAIEFKGDEGIKEKALDLLKEIEAKI